MQQILGRSDSTVVEQMPHHPKIKGLRPTTTAGAGIYKKAKQWLLEKFLTKNLL
jgi:hypothetical protein